MKRSIFARRNNMKFDPKQATSAQYHGDRANYIHSSGCVLANNAIKCHKNLMLVGPKCVAHTNLHSNC